MNKMRVIKIERKRLHDQQKGENKLKSVFKISKFLPIQIKDGKDG